MSDFDLEQFVYCLDKAITHLKGFEENFVGGDIEIFAQHARGIAANCCLARVFLPRLESSRMQQCGDVADSDYA